MTCSVCALELEQRLSPPPLTGHHPPDRLAFPSGITANYQLPESNCFLLPWVECSASSSSSCPLLSRTDTAKPALPFPLTIFPCPQLQSTTGLPFEGALSLFPAQVYNDISHGGVFEDGCLERDHVFPSIHDAVLFAQAKAQEVAPGHAFRGVRCLCLENPGPQGTEIAGRFGFQHQFCRLTFLGVPVNPQLRSMRMQV